MREAGSRHGPLVIRGGIRRDPAPLSHPNTPPPSAFPRKTRPARHKTPIFGSLEHAGRTFSRSRALLAEQGEKVAYSALRRRALKPTTPMLAPEQQPLKPSTPLHPETAPKTLVSRPQRRWRFQSHACTHKQRRWRFQTSVLPVVQSHRRATRPGPGCGARGRPWGATDINMPGAAGVEGAGGTGGHGRASRRGPGRGAGGRRRGLARQHTGTPTDWRPSRGLRGLAGLRADAPSEARGADGERAGRPRGGRRSVAATSNTKPPGPTGDRAAHASGR